MLQSYLSLRKVQFRMISVFLLLLSFTGESIASAYSGGRIPNAGLQGELFLTKKASSEGLQWTFDLICDAEADDESSSVEGIREFTDDNFQFYCGSLSSFHTLHQKISECSGRNYILHVANTETVPLVILHQSWKNFPV